MSNKNLRAILIIILGLVINTSSAMGLEERIEDGGFAPFIPKLPGYHGGFAPTLPKFGPELQVVKLEPKTKTRYTVQFANENLKPVTCDFLKEIIRRQKGRLAEIDWISDQIDSHRNLKSSDIKKLELLTNKYNLEISDSLNQKINFQVIWNFVQEYTKELNPLAFQLNVGYSAFNDFIVSAPGLQWQGNVSNLPPLFEINNLHKVKFEYSMSIMDFCFGEEDVTIQGKMAENFSEADPVLKAEWNRELSDKPQYGGWDIKKVSDMGGF